MLDCDFCNEFNGGAGIGGNPPIDRIVGRSGDVVVFPSLGAIVPGHILISPTYHVTASISARSADVEAIGKLLTEWSHAYRHYFGEEPVIFEHGDPTGQEVSYGQCVSHAHIHVLPKHLDMLAVMEARCKRLAIVPKGNLQQAVSTPYLMVSQDGELFHFFSAKAAPRQFLRALYSELLGAPERKEWYRFADEKKTAEDADRCRSILSKSPNHGT